MPRRTDINTILVIGSGPIVIGQACEFDYSGAQACKVLREEGFRVVLLNSNPATIMTDHGMADRTYIEPITPAFVEKIIIEENVDAVLPTLGGQTALNCAVAAAEQGIFEKHGVEIIGTTIDSIKKAEDRKLFADAMKAIGLDAPLSKYVHSVEEASEFAKEAGFPLVIRPSFTLGGAGGGIAFNQEELMAAVSYGIELSPASTVLVEESIIGWKELEMEVVRDSVGNAIVICSIENIDPMGVHTGDSITIAPALTLTDREYQIMHDASIKVLAEVGIKYGGSNVQFAIHPKTGRMVVIEMNPRVSRSSALASKATGYPIAQVSAKLAVGYTLDEIDNVMTALPDGSKTPAYFEPSIDYIACKVPRFVFEKFEGSDETLTTRMKSVGEAMALGHSLTEAINKCMRSLESGRAGLGADGKDNYSPSQLKSKLSQRTYDRIFVIAEALRAGMDPAEVAEISTFDPYFVGEIAKQVEIENGLRGRKLENLTTDDFEVAKRVGLSDEQIAWLLSQSCTECACGETRTVTEAEVRAGRKELQVLPVFKKVDSTAGEFPTDKNYCYKTYDDECEVVDAEKPRAMILGAGPNRIGQGIEFDYCCVHGAYALRDAGYETVMVNCNPETVSTDPDTSDRLYFEPLTFEDVMDIVEREKVSGVVVTFGGQTPLKLATALEEAGVPIMGTSPEAIDLAEDRERFSAVLDELGLRYPAAGTATTLDEAREVAAKVGYPLLVRPSYVLGGRGMVIAYSEDYLEEFMTRAAKISGEHPVLLDSFLEGAVEVDVDAVADGETVYIGGILEHIEEAGIHSGDSASCMPPFTLANPIIDEIREATKKLALRLNVKGLMNVQFAVKDGELYIIEVNPRASRTVPFVSKATEVPMAQIAARIMAGEKLADMDLPDDSVLNREHKRYFVKEAVIPFERFEGTDSVLGPEMKATGEVMGVGNSFPLAYAKAQLAIDYSLPVAPKNLPADSSAPKAAFLSVSDRDKRDAVSIARDLHNMGFELMATGGTEKVLAAAGLPVKLVKKKSEGRPNILDHMKNGEVALVINTPHGEESRGDGYWIRSMAVQSRIPNMTNLATAHAMVQAIEAADLESMGITAMQDFMKDV
ncbi:MAG: carbamoyl-phosphate synthase large subunit [Coriobacteriia bacterium]|nr:carbamoyl-phosphate synthase large subunit [Coriobacteriia bacterium]